MSENYDLGTAHAKIKVTADERGIKDAERAFAHWDKGMAEFKTTVGRLEHSINSLERSVDDLNSTVKRSEREFDKYDGTVKETSKSHSKLSNSINVLNGDFNTLIERLKTAGSLYAKLKAPTAFGIKFTKDVRSGEDSLKGLGKAFVSSGIAAAGLKIGLRSISLSLLGVNSAMQNVTGWRRSFLNLTGPILTTVAGLRLMNRLSNGGIVTLAQKIPFVTGALQKLTKAWDGNTRGLKDFVKGTERFVGGTRNFIIGAAIAKTAFDTIVKPLNLLRKMDMKWLAGGLAGLGLIAPTLELAGKGLIKFSDLLLSALGVVKQMSGALLAYPGIIATVLGVFGTVKFALKGVEDAFKAAGEASDEDFTKALEKLPTQSLRDMAKAIRQVKPQWDALQQTLQQTMTAGFAQDIKDLTDTYIPALFRGMNSVAQALNGAKNDLVGFATQQSTVDKLGLSFLYTSKIVTGLSDQINPLMTAILQLSVSSQEALSGLTGSMDGLIAKFAQWVDINSKNGNIHNWIYDAVTGVRQLFNGLKDAGEAVWNILTAFSRTGGSDNPIKDFAQAMQKFNDAVDKSKATGFLASMNKALDGLGTEKLAQLKDLFTSKDSFSINPWNHLGPTTGVLELLKSLIPLARDIGEGFSQYFVPSLKTAMGLIKTFAEIIDNLGLDGLIGKILGFAAAWRFVDKALSPFLKTGVIFVGIKKALGGMGDAARGFASIISGALRQAGLEGASEKFDSVSDAVGGIAEAAGIAGTAIFFFYEQFQDVSDQIEKSNAQLEESQQHFTDWKTSVDKAMLADKGKTGKNTLSTIAEGIQTGKADLENAIDTNATSWWTHLQGIFFAGNKLSDFMGGAEDARVSGSIDPKWVNDMQEAKAHAESTKKALDDLGLSDDELAAKLASTEGFAQVSNSLQSMGTDGANASEFVKKLRDEIVKLQDEYKNAGDGNIQAVEGLKAIADAGGDATQKLKGLESVLKGLGLLQTDAYDAAFAHAEAIRKITTEAQGLVDAQQPLGDSALFKDGGLNFDSTNAKNLYLALGEAAANLRDIKSQGGDVATAYNDILKSLPDLSTAFQVDPAKVRGILDNVLAGFATTQMNLNLDPAIAGKSFHDVSQMLPYIQNLLNGKVVQGPQIQVPMPVMPNGKPADTPQSWQDLFGVNSGQKPVEIPTVPVLDPKAPKDAAAAAITPPTPIPIPAVVAPAPTQGPQTTAVAPPAPVAPPPVQLPQAPVVSAQANPYAAAMQQAVDSADKLATEMNTKFAAGLVASMGLVADAALQLGVGLSGVLTAQAERTYQSGLSVGQAFARGVSAQSSLDAARNAALALMNAASNPMPRSPAKIGPFSGKGYSLFRGKKLATDFADGVNAGSSAVAGATSGMMGSSSSTMDEGITTMLKDITELTGFGKSLMDIVQSFSDIAFSVIDLVTTDWATGKSKLAKTFKKTVSDEDLAQTRADQFQSSIGNLSDMKSLSFGKLPADLKNLPAGNAKGSEAGLTPAALATRRIVSNMFPQIGEIGGVRADALQWHPSGRGLDFMIPGGDTSGGANPQGKALGDQVAAFLQANKEALGINHILWQTMQGGNHFNHVHAGFDKGAIPDLEAVTSDLTKNTKKAADAVASVPNAVGTLTDTPGSAKPTLVPGKQDEQALADAIKQNTKDDKLTAKESKDLNTQQVLDDIIAQGKGRGATTDEISAALASAMQDQADNAAYLSPQDQAKQFFDSLAANPSGSIQDRIAASFGSAEVPSGFMGDLVTSSRLINDKLGVSNDHLGTIDGNTLSNAKSTEDLYNDFLGQNTALQDAINVGKDAKSTDEQRLKSVQDIEGVLQGLPEDTAQNRALRGAIEQQQSDIMQQGGITETGGPVDQAKSIFGNLASVAGDVFAVIDQSLKSIEAAKDIGDTLVRGVANTKDVENIIDGGQEFLTLASKIFKAGASITGAIGAIAGAAGAGDPTGGGAAAGTAIQAVSQIFGLISSAIDTINATIDLVQEGWHIAGKYIGRGLKSILGLSGAAGDVKFLLDTNTGVLKSYSSDNPQDKKERLGYNMFPNKNAGPAAVNYLTVYGGPGQDPRDTMSDAMWAVNTQGSGVYGG